MPRILLVPGHRRIGEGHWQSLWAGSLPDARLVDLLPSEHPRLQDWIWRLDAAIDACEEPPILVAHALGCLALVHWAGRHQRRVRAALLVAPVDVESRSCPEGLRSFAPIPKGRLPFPTTLAASSNDPLLTQSRAKTLALDWDSLLVDLGPCGGLNSASGHGPWARGEALLAELR